MRNPTLGGIIYVAQFPGRGGRGRGGVGLGVKTRIPPTRRNHLRYKLCRNIPTSLQIAAMTLSVGEESGGYRRNYWQSANVYRTQMPNM